MASDHDSTAAVSWVSYLLHFVVAVAAVIPGLHVSVFLLIVAFIIDLVKKSDARGTFEESHFSWRLRTVVFTGALYFLTFPLFFLLYLPGLLAWGLISIWFLYRIVRGIIALSNRRAV